MYSEEFVKYLLKYQSDNMKPEKKEEEKKTFDLSSIKKKYATIPIITK